MKINTLFFLKLLMASMIALVFITTPAYAESSFVRQEKNTLQTKKTLSHNEKILLKEYDILVYVKGLVCSFCAQGIQTSFEKNPKIAKVSVNLEKRALLLKLKAFKKITASDIQKTVEDAGYDLESLYQN